MLAVVVIVLIGGMAVAVVTHLRSSDRPGPRPPALPQTESAAASLILAGIGGSLATLSLVALPMFGVPILGSISLPTLIGFAGRFSGGVYLFWLVPLLTAYIAVTGFRLRYGAVRENGEFRTANGYLSLGCVVALLAHLVLFALPGAAINSMSSSMSSRDSLAMGASTLQIGYFTAVLGVLLALLGSRIAARRLRPSPRAL